MVILFWFYCLKDKKIEFISVILTLTMNRRKSNLKKTKQFANQIVRRLTLHVILLYLGGL